MPTQFDETRLRKICDFLKQNNFNGVAYFNFDSWVSSNMQVKDGHICGTSACAIGMLPIIFPEHIQFQLPARIGLIIENKRCDFNSNETRTFLNLDKGEFNILFTPCFEFVYPNNCIIKFSNIRAYVGTPTAVQVANQIDKFIAFRNSSSYYYYQMAKRGRWSKLIALFLDWYNR